MPNRVSIKILNKTGNVITSGRLCVRGGTSEHQRATIETTLQSFIDCFNVRDSSSGNSGSDNVSFYMDGQRIVTIDAMATGSAEEVLDALEQRARVKLGEHKKPEENLIQVTETALSTLSRTLERLKTEYPGFAQTARLIESEIKSYETSKKCVVATLQFREERHMPSALLNFYDKCMVITSQTHVEDPLYQRAWHRMIVAIKSSFNLLDGVQALVTGARIDKEGRQHVIQTPRLLEEAEHIVKKELNQIKEKIENSDTSHSPKSGS